MKQMAYQTFGWEIFGESMQFRQIRQNFALYGIIDCSLHNIVIVHALTLTGLDLGFNLI